MAIGKFSKTRHSCNGKAKELFNQYCEHLQVAPDEFKGIELEDFYTLENFYEVQLFAMSLKEDGSAETLYLSQTSYQIKIYRVSQKKSIDKKLLFGAAQAFNSQLLNLFGFSISVRTFIVDKS